MKAALAFSFSFLLGAALSIFVASKIARAVEPTWESLPVPAQVSTLLSQEFIPSTLYPSIEFIPPKLTDSAVSVFNTTNGKSREVARITNAGRIYLNGREVHTDRQYRAAMMEIMKGMAGCHP